MVKLVSFRIQVCGDPFLKQKDGAQDREAQLVSCGDGGRLILLIVSPEMLLLPAGG
jgi:hypothetical protein